MHVTLDGGYVLPEIVNVGRKVARGRKTHFSGHFIAGSGDAERVIDFESHTELVVGLVLNVRPDVVLLEHQVLFAFTNADG